MPRHHRLALGCTAIISALTSCSGPDPANNMAAGGDMVDTPAVARQTARQSDSAAGATTGGDGSQIDISALSAADLDRAKLSGELGCSFAGGDATLLVAKGNVASSERAFGVVKIGGYVEPVSAAGGYDGMAGGTTFAGKGMTIAVAITDAATGGGESPPRPATLTFDRADGARRILVGDWVCGP